MSDDSDEEFWSLYESIIKKNIPNVKDRKNKKSITILENTSVTNAEIILGKTRELLHRESLPSLISVKNATSSGMQSETGQNNSSTIHGQSWNSKVKRKHAKQPENIASLLKPAAQSHSTEIIGSDPSSDDAEFNVPQNKFLKKKFKKFKSLSLEDNQHETHGKPESEIEDIKRNKMKSISEIHSKRSQSNKLTFDSAAVFNSTLIGSPISKSAKNVFKDNTNFSTKLKNDGSTCSKHNNLYKVMAASTQHKEKPVRNKEKHSSDALTTEKRKSHNYQYVDALKDLSRVENQSESDKVYTFKSSERKHMSQHKEDRSNQHIIYSQQLVVSNNNEGVLSNVLRSTHKSKEMENCDKIDINLSSDKRTSCRKLGNSEIALSLAPETKTNVIEIANSDKIVASKSSDSDESQGDPLIHTHTRLIKKNYARRRCRIRGNNLYLKQPAPWVNNRFYNKLMPFFENKFGPLKCYSICESRAVDIHDNVKKALKNPKHQEICVNNVRKILYDVGVLKTPMDFMLFSADYLPNKFNLIAIPKRMGIYSIGVPYPKDIGLYDDFNL